MLKRAAIILLNIQNIIPFRSIQIIIEKTLNVFFDRLVKSHLSLSS